jgi:hypothetical protein
VDVMMFRAKQMFELYHKRVKGLEKIDFDELSKNARLGWYDVACAEASRIETVHASWKDAIDKANATIASMVTRKHYTDAIKSLSMCQNQIETMMLALRGLDPDSFIVRDAEVILGLLEAMIMANPDMQTEEWSAKLKAEADKADRERRAEVQQQMWGAGNNKEAMRLYANFCGHNPDYAMDWDRLTPLEKSKWIFCADRESEWKKDILDMEKVNDELRDAAWNAANLLATVLDIEFDQ